jgi:hypothetical protein
LTLAYPHARRQLARVVQPPDEVTRGYLILASGDSTLLKRQLTLIRQMGRGKAPGTSIDGNLRRARLALSVADTAAALDELDPVLRALPTLSPTVLSQVSQISALVRAMALRSEIAAARGDHQNASMFASAVVSLWSGADQSLQPLVQRMRALVQ